MDHQRLKKADRIIQKTAKLFSYISGGALLFMACSGAINIISSKLFGKAMLNVNELTDYLLIAVVYCSVAFCQLNGGLVSVDIFYRKYNEAAKKSIRAIGCILGMIAYAFAAFQSISLLGKHLSLKTTAASTLTSFQIWPFTLLYVAGSFFLAFTLVWTLVRTPLGDEGNEGEEGDAGGKGGNDEEVKS
jgi:TRAP-type C4-dicarboxylate transport system permease small subunit